MANKKQPDTQLNQKALLNLMREIQPDYHEYEYRDFLETFVEAVERTILQGKGVKLGKVGLFKVGTQKARTVRNPKTGETKEMPDRPKLKFVFSVQFKKDFRKLMYTWENNNETGVAEP